MLAWAGFHLFGPASDPFCAAHSSTARFRSHLRVGPGRQELLLPPVSTFLLGAVSLPGEIFAELDPVRKFVGILRASASPHPCFLLRHPIPPSQSSLFRALAPAVRFPGERLRGSGTWDRYLSASRVPVASPQQNAPKPAPLGQARSWRDWWNPLWGGLPLLLARPQRNMPYFAQGESASSTRPKRTSTTTI